MCPIPIDRPADAVHIGSPLGVEQFEDGAPRARASALNHVAVYNGGSLSRLGGELRSLLDEQGIQRLLNLIELRLQLKSPTFGVHLGVSWTRVVGRSGRSKLTCPLRRSACRRIWARLMSRAESVP